MFVCEKKGENPGPASVASTIHWAETQNREVDMFVILSNFMVETAGARAAINKYRSNMKLPNAKYVPCLFCFTIIDIQKKWILEPLVFNVFNSVETNTEKNKVVLYKTQQ